MPNEASMERQHIEHGAREALRAVHLAMPASVRSGQARALALALVSLGHEFPDLFLLACETRIMAGTLSPVSL